MRSPKVRCSPIFPGLLPRMSGFNVGRTQAQEELPIAGARDEILDLLEKHDFVVVVGDTGSGKTTQIPTYLLDADDVLLKDRREQDNAIKEEDEEKPPVEKEIVVQGKKKSSLLFAPVTVTQPRRVAATSVSVREEACLYN
jgi:hypothetical protein